MVVTGHEKQTGTESKTTPASREWACGHSKVPQLRHDWATVVNKEKEKGSTCHGGPAAATCMDGTKASPCAEHHPPRLGSGVDPGKERETKGPQHGGPVTATSMLGNTA